MKRPSQQPRKRSYEPPKLYGINAIEAGSATCCKATTATCSNAAKSGGGKGQRTSSTS